jgi:hypothetical protein
MTATATLPTAAALDSGGRPVDWPSLGWAVGIGEGNGRVTVYPFARAAFDAVAA